MPKMLLVASDFPFSDVLLIFSRRDLIEGSLLLEL
jgi:hypothetical protein